MQEKKIKAFSRIATAQARLRHLLPRTGIICLGPVTRGGCDARCMTSGVPCRGCFGPPDGVVDMGAKAISAIASVIDAKEEAEVQRIIDQIPDSLRSFNRFGIPASLIRRKVL